MKIKTSLLLGTLISVGILAFTVAPPAFACGAGCRTFCGSYYTGPLGHYCQYDTQVCDPACPANAPPAPAPAPASSGGGGSSGQCSGYCLGNCGVSAATCATLTALSTDAGVTRTVLDNTTGASTGQTSVRSTQGGTFDTTLTGTLNGGYYVNTMGRCADNTTCSTMNCTGAVCTVPNIPGLTGVVFYCPGGLTNGVCLQGMQTLTIQPGQTINLATYLSSGCGAVQVDFDTAGTAAGTGNNGAATIDTGKTCGSSAAAATALTSNTSAPTSTPTPTPAGGVCVLLKVYKNSAFVDPSTLQPGDSVTFVVDATNASQARLSINGATPIVTGVKDANNSFTFPYTIPAGQATYTVTAEVFSNGTWQ